MEPVTLLHFTPLCTDGYGPQDYGRCPEGYGSSSASACSIPPQEVDTHHLSSMETSGCSLPPYNYVGPSSCEAYGRLASYCDHQQQQEQRTLANSVSQDYDPEYGALLVGNPGDMADCIDVGPPPVRLPRLEAPMSVDTTAGGVEAGYPSPGSSFYGPGSGPHSPMSSGAGDLPTTLPRSNKTYPHSKTYPKSRTKATRAGKMVRATSPIFPDQSTPLSSLRRQPSVSSIASTKSSEQLSSAFSISVSVKSDPELRSTEPTSDSPPVNSAHSQQGFEFCSTASSIGSPSSLSTTSSRAPQGVGLTDGGGRSGGGSRLSCLELEIPAKYAHKISNLDKKILKLQVERSKLLEKAQQQQASIGFAAAPTTTPWCVDMDAWLLPDKLPEVGKAHLYIVPLGIHELDEPLYDDANRLLRQVGGLYLDLQTSISMLRGICCKGVFIPAEISTCFAYIKSLLHENQKLKLSNLQGVYSIQLDDDMGAAGGEAGGVVEAALPGEFAECLTAANHVLKCAQHITQAYTPIQMQLLKLRQVASKQADSWQKLGVAADRERRGQIRAVLEGNCITMASAERVWPQYYEAATQTIKSITECIHPSNTQ